MGIEDSAVMVELLAEVQRRLQSTAPDGGGPTAADALEVAFQTFDACQRERTSGCCKIPMHAVTFSNGSFRPVGMIWRNARRS
jgi:hypothetical protein